MKQRRVIVGILSVVFLLGVLSCDEGTSRKSADEIQKEKTERAMQEAERQVGMPNITNFQERKLAKMIFELRDREDLVTHAYIKSEYTGKLHYLGKCIGYGLPYSVQYTNPERIAHKNNYNGGSFGTLSQPDPNGLFMPQGLSATWLMLIDPETDEPRPVYVESDIVVSPFLLQHAVEN